MIVLAYVLLLPTVAGILLCFATYISIQLADDPWYT